MLWALVTRLNDILAVIGLGTLFYWIVKAALYISHKFRRSA